MQDSQAASSNANHGQRKRSASQAFASKKAVGPKRNALGDLTNANLNGNSENFGRGQPKKRQKRSSTSASSDTSSSCSSSVAITTPGGGNFGGSHLVDIDAKDRKNPQMCVTYVDEIIRHYRAKEMEDPIKHDYMDGQVEINYKMRAILIDWLVEVHLKFRLKTETLYLCVTILDRFLATEQVSRQKLQLVGCTSLLLAAKVEEVYAPEVRDLIYISDRAYSRQDVLACEQRVLGALKYKITFPSGYLFLNRFIKVAYESIPGVSTMERETVAAVSEKRRRRGREIAVDADRAYKAAFDAATTAAVERTQKAKKKTKMEKPDAGVEEGNGTVTSAREKDGDERRGEREDKDAGESALSASASAASAKEEADKRENVEEAPISPRTAGREASDKVKAEARARAIAEREPVNSVRLLAGFYLQRSLQEVRMLEHCPSVSALAAVTLALEALSFPPWCPELEHHSGYTQGEVCAARNDMLAVLVRSNRSSLKAVVKKYSSSKLGSVALIPFPSGEGFAYAYAGSANSTESSVGTRLRGGGYAGGEAVEEKRL